MLHRDRDSITRIRVSLVVVGRMGMEMRLRVSIHTWRGWIRRGVSLRARSRMGGWGGMRGRTRKGMGSGITRGSGEGLGSVCV